MGLDAVEIILRTEEFFSISIEDAEASSTRTVGEFYELICAKLDIPALQAPVTARELPVVTEKEQVLFLLAKHKPLLPPPEVLPWSPQSTWDCLVAILVDQQCLSPTDIQYHARFVEDLGIS